MLRRIILAVLLLSLLISLSGCATSPEQPQLTLADSLQPFMDALEQPDLAGMNMTAYVWDMNIMSKAHSVEELISNVNEHTSGYKIYIDNAIMQQHVELLSQINPESFVLERDSSGGIDATTHIIFESGDNEVLLTITLGGFAKNPVYIQGQKTDRTLFVNGFEVTFNDVFFDLFYQLIDPRLPAK